MKIGKKMKPKYLILILMLLSGCVAPDTIVLNKFPEGKTIILKKLNGNDQAEEINHNSFRIFPNSIISLKFLESTEKLIQFELIPETTGKIEFNLYTTQIEYPEKSPFKLELREDGYLIEKDNKIIAQSDTIKISPQTKYVIKFQKDANLLKIFINCDVINISPLFLKSTEYLIIRSDEKLKAIIQGIDYIKIY